MLVSVYQLPRAVRDESKKLYKMNKIVEIVEREPRYGIVKGFRKKSKRYVVEYEDGMQELVKPKYLTKL
jgi:hypothetical protein